jgi:hypothetical protein
MKKYFLILLVTLTLITGCYYQELEIDTNVKYSVNNSDFFDNSDKLIVNDKLYLKIDLRSFDPKEEDEKTALTVTFFGLLGGLIERFFARLFGIFALDNIGERDLITIVINVDFLNYSFLESYKINEDSNVSIDYTKSNVILTTKTKQNEHIIFLVNISELKEKFAGYDKLKGTITTELFFDGRRVNSIKDEVYFNLTD